MEGEQDEEMTDSPAVESQNPTNRDTNGNDPSQTGGKSSEVESASGEKSDTNGETDDAQPVMSPGKTESPNSKSSMVATLRAAFEQTDEPFEGIKRRFTNGHTQEQEAEIARMKQELAKERELRAAFEEKVTSLEEEIEELNSQLEEQDEKWRDECERRRQLERSEAQERLMAMAEEARNQRQEVGNLQKQLSDLKRSVSTSTRPSTHVSDVTFREEAGVLQHEVQNWIVQNFRRSKIELSAENLCEKLESLTEQRQYARLQPIYKDFESSAKLPILQATVACFLMDIFEEPYLFGLHGIVEWAERSRQAAEALLSVLEPAAYNRCRAVTFDALRQSESIKAIVETSALEVARKISAVLLAVAEVAESDARLTSLTSIMKRAIDLAHLIRVQQARYDVILPSPADTFDSASMDDVLEEGDVDLEHTIKFATFPAIFKTTDEEGIQADSKSVVAKARVLCRETED